MMEGVNPDLVYVPGTWECPHCGFVLGKNFLNAYSGAVAVNNEDIAERCPNDGTLLERQTWRSRAESAEKMLVDAMERESRP